MDYIEYLEFVCKKMKEAQERGDKVEWVRLAKVLIETTLAKIKELSK